MATDSAVRRRPGWRRARRTVGITLTVGVGVVVLAGVLVVRAFTDDLDEVDPVTLVLDFLFGDDGAE